jgi:hypothetical protein
MSRFETGRPRGPGRPARGDQETGRARPMTLPELILVRL